MNNVISNIEQHDIDFSERGRGFSQGDAEKLRHVRHCLVSINEEVALGCRIDPNLINDIEIGLNHLEHRSAAM